ncbi:MAG: VPLPA-CTERM sorting domain-containing protein [Pikeienuella sp.]|uniref:VPLPA-CTERM sorting domain-containing protein n=1 Tax=Pikeienuella sp. TaxID=2831957 RepID=UPI003919EED7
MNRTFFAAACVATAALASAMAPTPAKAVSIESVTPNPASYAEIDLLTTTVLPDFSSWNPAPSTRTGNIPGVTRSPFDETSNINIYSNGSGIPESTPYFSVGPDNPSNPAILEFTVDQRAFSFLWGSPDSYNELTFFLDGQEVITFLGTVVQPPIAVGSAFVEFKGKFDAVSFFSDGSNAFEWTSMSATAVPLPAAAWMMLAGLASLGFVARRKRAAA